jgi:hypothetical protein
MFIQVLGIMTLQSPSFSFTAKLFFSVSQQPVQHLTMLQAQGYHRAKTFLTEDVFLPKLLSDNLSDVPEDILVMSGNDKDNAMRERKTVHPKKSYSESQTSSQESGNSNYTSIAGQTMVGKRRQNA